MTKGYWKKSIGVLAGVLVLSSVLAGCGNSSESSTGSGSTTGTSETVIYDWQNADSYVYKMSEQLAKEYNARKDAKTTMKVQHIPGTDRYYPKLNAELAANAGPDVFVSHAAGKLKTYADSGRIMDLTEILNADPEWKKSFTSGAFNLLTFDNKVYAIPTAFATVPLFYNKEIFAKYKLTPPTTYEELKNVIKVLKDNGVTPFAFGAKESWTSALFSEMVANRIGGDEPFNKLMEGTGTWMDPSYIQTGNVMNELRDMGAFPSGFLGLDNTAITNMFKNGEAAMFVMGSWAVGSVEAADSKVQGKIGIAKFPTFEGGKGDLNTWLGQPSYNLVIRANTKNKDAALEYIKAWTSNDIQTKLAEENGDIPAVNVKLDKDKVPAVAQDLQKEMSDMKGMFIFYDVGLGAKIGDEYNTTIQAILAGQSPEEAFQSLEQFTQDNKE